MASERYAVLCERVRQYCAQRRWYGPHSGSERKRWHYADDGSLRAYDVTHDFHTGFEFPPASEGQLHQTEAALGFAIPPLLRALYATVANGGFGPAYGITGAHGGFCFGGDEHYATLDQNTAPPWTRTDPNLRDLNLADYERQLDNPRQPFDPPPHTWPERFIHLCYWGCGEDAYLDAGTEHVYHYDGQLRLVEVSLEAWLETWLAGQWRRWFGPEPLPGMEDPWLETREATPRSPLPQLKDSVISSAGVDPYRGYVARAKALWESVRKICMTQSRPTAALLMSVRPLAIQPDTTPPRLIIETNYAFHRMQLNRPEFREVVEWALEEALGLPIHVLVVHLAPDPNHAELRYFHPWPPLEP